VRDVVPAPFSSSLRRDDLRLDDRLKNTVAALADGFAL
jgi:hypothetical protein